MKRIRTWCAPTPGLATYLEECQNAQARLNVERLRVPRERRWRALSRNWSHHFDDPEVMESAACRELLPKQGGDLPKFFTTSRSYLGPDGERLLEQDTRRWV